jgi:2-polyprenyl-3-methyl-5-hydroxy-6-metoxy-1,4-benzoquinol methylase
MLQETSITESSKAAIERKIREFAPFHHDIELPFGLRTHIPDMARQERERTRLKTLIDHAWPALLEACGGSLKGLRVLDVACNCGGFSVKAAQEGASHVLGIDVEAHYLKQANFIKETLALRNVEFQSLPLEDLDPKIHGHFDVTLCFGILYHLENPTLGMQKIAAVTDKVIMVDTTLMRVPFINRLLKQPLWHMRVVSAVSEDATNISTSRWRKSDHCQFSPNAAAVNLLLDYVGFDDVSIVKPKAGNPEKRYLNGTRATFIAKRSSH